ncbi:MULTISPECIES: MbcA/ParS/Xre antitoxin family protein [Burkholderia cepacia complex]|uniref:MbcA/ParS/Xre antitoxin family protein n=1 Tax=Burkholderia cepacia complex TaxID=87882 RepID=UPI001589CC41|nr:MULTISPECIES: MbcA/ParS/Xre antitoxin family protein [Burkholderia cepacia complex]MCA8094470.1 MbcA/ParS/Xre antitoxin family protein [Burkholderia anthina]MDN7616613.1 MbcA/ParS/Xre antitoxin family protein [Burkholderia cepacia]
MSKILDRELRKEKLVRLVQAIIDESSDPDSAMNFDAAAWLEDWLCQPNPALGGALPLSYIDSDEGQELLASLISSMQSGAYF